MNTLSCRIKFFRLITTVMLLTSILISCDMLEVNDPSVISGDQLNDPTNEELIINGVYGEFHSAYDVLINNTGIFSDELVIDHTSVDDREFSVFNYNRSNLNNKSTFTALQNARVIAEDAVERISEFYDDGGEGNLNIALAYAYAGYATIFLGENFCKSPINSGPALSSDELLERGMDELKQAITTANNATGDAEQVNRIINISNVGLARASLQIGNMEDATKFASKVPRDFEAYIPYSTNSGGEENSFGGLWLSQNKVTGVGPEFRNLDDPRVRHPEEPFQGLTGEDTYPPYRPFSFEGWNPNNPTQKISRDTDIQFASGLQAQYIIAEARGPTSETLTFVNNRRAVGGGDPVNVAGDDLMAELREQRSRDLFLTGQRHGDLRRYINLYNIDLFPTGANEITGEQYGDMRCFIIPQSEINANPNL